MPAALNGKDGSRGGTRVRTRGRPVAGRIRLYQSIKWAQEATLQDMLSSDAGPWAGSTHVRPREWLRLRVPRGLGFVVMLALTVRLALSAMAAWLLSFHPFHISSAIRPQLLGQTPLRDAIIAPWQRFDAFWYARLAAHGYGAHDGSTVYFPLYPLLIRSVASLLRVNDTLAALIVSNMCFVGLLLLLYRFVADHHGESAARRTLLLLCVFPTASFLLGAYTESLFLLLVVGCFLAAERERWALAGVLGFLAGLTRLQGIVLMLPLVAMAFADARDSVRTFRPYLLASAPALGVAVFFLYVRLVMRAGSVTTVYHQQVHQQLGPPWATLQSYWTALAAHHWRLFAYATGNWVDAMNMLLALVVLALVLPARRALGTPLWLYALGTWAVTLCIHQSTARYMLTVFPAFIVAAVWLPGRRVPQLALLLGAPVMLFVAGEFVLWSFVG